MQPLLPDERHDDVPMQHGHVQVRMQHDQGRRVHDVHQRRQCHVRHDPGVLRLHVRLHEGRLHVLHAAGRHARVLWFLLRCR